MSGVAELDQAGNTAVERWAATVRAAWAHACKWEGIDPPAPFVVFSPENPIIPFYEIALRKFWEAGANRNAVGYEGLVIERGKAVTDPDNKRRRATPLRKQKGEAA